MGIAYAVLFGLCYFSTMVLNTVENNSNISESIMLFIILINIIVSLVCIYKGSKGDKKILFILTTAFCIRIILMMFDLYGRNIWILPGSGIDTEMFHDAGLKLGSYEIKDNPYGYFVGLIYSISMNQRVIAQYVNLLFGMSVLLITLKIMDELDIDYNVKLISLFIISFIPNYIIMSVILLRESIMIISLAVSLLYFIKWWKYNNIFYFITSISLVLFGSIFHSGVIGNALGYLIIFILFNNRERKLNINIKTIILSIFIIFVVITFFNSDSNIFTSKFGNVEDINDIVYRAEVAESGGSAYVVGGEVNSLMDLVKNSPIRMFYFITSPLPWAWRGLNDIIAFLFSALFYLVSYIYAIRSFKLKINNKKYNFIKAIFIICILGAFVFAWGTSNAGTAMRHRDKFIVNYVVMLALALESMKLSKIKNKNLYFYK